MLKFGDALSEFERVRGNYQERNKATARIIEILRGITKENDLPRAAMKELLPIDEAVNANIALARMKNEIEAARSVQHPALIRILDVEDDGKRFVMEYFPDGPLGKMLERFRGRVLESFRAFRPIVEAVAALHGAGIVHRDIKPENVFVRSDGRLVLGDLGLAFKLQDRDRVTDTFENVGTRDYQLQWSYAMRLEEVRPTFDVFSLGKLLWALVSGRPRFPLDWFEEEPHGLRAMFPANPDVLFVHRLMKKCIALREESWLLPDAAALLSEVDLAIRALEAGAQLPGRSRKMRCRFCGLGSYNKADDFQVVGNLKAGARRDFYCCDHCGHLESFVFFSDAVPPAWTD